MSRTATATPPPPMFNQKNSTPSARHASKGASHAPPPAACGYQRHFKPSPKHSQAPLHTSPLKQTVVPMSASDMLGIATVKSATPDPLSKSQTGSILESRDSDSVSLAASVPSMVTDHSGDSFPTIVTPESNTPPSSIYGDAVKVPPSVPVANMVSPTPRSWVNGIGKMARAASGMMSSFGRRPPRDGESPRLASPVQSPMAAAALSPLASVGSTPYIAPSPLVASVTASPVTPMSPMAFMLTPAPEVQEMLEPALPPHALPPAVAHPHNMPPAIPPDSPTIENPAEALRRYEWAEEQRKLVTEFARLCSQWPRSSYNLSKWGPHGCPNTSYVPQSWANPRHVMRTMQKQAELERTMCERDTTFFRASPQSTRSSSTDGDSEPSLYSFVSTQSSVATTVSRGEQDRAAQLCAAVWAAAAKVDKPIPTEVSELQTAADLHAAMHSPMMESWRGDQSVVSVSSAVSVATCVTDDKDDSKTTSAWASLASSSLGELDRMAELATNDRMDVDEPEGLASIPHVACSHPTPPARMARPVRASSCPAKRPLTLVADDEDKRRRVDEPMVVDDSATPVFTEEPAVLSQTMAASAPNLAQQVVTTTVAQQAVLFGHVVKTSDSHPIIISPFIPEEILSTLGKYFVATPTSPLLLASELDVPSLLLSCAGPSQSMNEAGPTGSPSQDTLKTLIFNPNRPRGGIRTPTRLGNMLLSSCPGKRLRMDGPVKGRGPVCRDLATDLRRIKSAGVGAIVCCLDDEELELLGVPWELYRDLASDIGLDIIRLPMPDGFTPVSLQLFDAQVSLIAEQYTLKGVNVLVHCRGGIGRAGLTACAWAIKMGFVQPHPSLLSSPKEPPAPSKPSRRPRRAQPAVPSNDEERAIVMSMVERAIAMIRSRRGLKAIESMEQVHFLSTYVTWLRECNA